MRMERAGRPSKWNTFQQRLVRLRPSFNIISWHATHLNPRANLPSANILAKLTSTQLEMNSSRGLTPGLLVPEFGEDGGRVPLPDTEDSRGFGRAYRKRQGQSTTGTGSNSGPAQAGSSGSTTMPQKRTRRSTMKKAEAQTASASQSSESDQAGENSSEGEREHRPYHRQRNRESQAIVISAPSPSQGSTVGRTRTSHCPTTNHAQQSNPQRPMGYAEYQYQQSAGANITPQSTIQHGAAATAQSGQGLSRTPYFMSNLVGHRSTTSPNVIGFNGMGGTSHRSRYPSYTRMDARQLQRRRFLPLYQSLPNVNPALISAIQDGGHGASSNSRGAHRTAINALPITNDSSNPANQTWLRFVHRLHVLADTDLLTEDTSAEALDLQQMV